MAEFNFGQALQGLGGLGQAAGAWAGSYLGVPKSESNKRFLKKAGIVGNWQYGASDMSGLMRQWQNTPTLHNISGEDLYNPSSEELFGSIMGAGMSSYGAMSNLTAPLKGALGLTSFDARTRQADRATAKGDLGQPAGVTKENIMNEAGYNSDTELAADLYESQFNCGGHMHGCGGHKFVGGGFAGFDWGTGLSTALDLASAGVGIGLSYAGIMDQKRKAEMDANEVNAANLYAQQLQQHNLNEALNDTKNNTARWAALQTMAYGGNLFNMGGDLHAHGADYPLLGDYNIIGAGGTHEQNPFGGVFQGMAIDGKPNLVEEDEVVWNDYVFSNRLTIPKDFAKERKLKEGITYAQAAQKLAKEAEERPNDPISQNGIAEALGALQISQEDLKQKLEAARVKKAVAKMSPEEVMNMVAALQGGQQEQTVEQPMGYAANGGSLFADGGSLGDYSHIFEGTNESSSKMTRKQKAAQEAARKEQESIAKRNAARLDKLIANMSYDELNNYAAGLQGYDASQYGTTGSLDALREFVKNHGDYNTFVDHINNAQNLRYLEGDPDYTWSYDGYDDSDFRKMISTPYDASKIPGNTAKHYSPDEAMIPTAAEREKDPNYIATTNYVKQQLLNMQTGKSYDKDIIDEYVKWLDSNVAPNTVKLGVYDNNGNLTGLTEGAADLYERLRTDKIPGVYHQNFIAPKGDKKGARTVYRIGGKNVELTDEQLQNNPYLKELKRETVDDGDGKSTTYVDVAANPYDTEVEDSVEETAPQGDIPALQTITRRAPVWGAALGTLAAMKPAKDYSTAFSPRVAHYETIGDYLPYLPVDTQRYINAENQQVAAQLNAIMNASAGNRNMAMAQAALANAQRQQGIGQRMQAAEAINWDRRRQAGEFNRGTNMFKAQAHNQSDLANLQNNPLLLRQEQQNAMMRHTVDSERDAAISANLNALLDSLGDIGRENFYYNQANSNQALGYGIDANPWFGGKSFFKKPIMPKKAGAKANFSDEEDVQAAALGGYLMSKPKKNRR